MERTSKLLYCPREEPPPYQEQSSEDNRLCYIVLAIIAGTIVYSVPKKLRGIVTIGLLVSFGIYLSCGNCAGIKLVASKRFKKSKKQDVNPLYYHPCRPPLEVNRKLPSNSQTGGIDQKQRQTKRVSQSNEDVLPRRKNPIPLVSDSCPSNSQTGGIDQKQRQTKRVSQSNEDVLPRRKNPIPSVSDSWPSNSHAGGIDQRQRQTKRVSQNPIQ